MSSIFPQQSSTRRWTKIQVGSQGKDWDQPRTFTKARIIIGFDTEPTYRISLPEIPHPVLRLLQYSETDKQQPYNILPVANNIRD